MNVAYPNLTGEIAKRGIKKTVMAKTLGITERALYSKLNGLTQFTWDEVCTINSCFFPDANPTDLFARKAP